MKRSNRWMPYAFGTLMLAALSFAPVGDRTARADEHRDLNPKIHHAIEALKDAHDEIDSAHHDFHGRKKEALDVLDKAINELEAIKDYDQQLPETMDRSAAQCSNTLRGASFDP